jgi:hypothetical protein
MRAGEFTSNVRPLHPGGADVTKVPVGNEPIGHR